MTVAGVLLTFSFQCVFCVCGQAIHQACFRTPLLLCTWFSVAGARLRFYSGPTVLDVSANGLTSSSIVGVTCMPPHQWCPLIAAGPCFGGTNVCSGAFCNFCIRF
jgi:hypothetical protein